MKSFLIIVRTYFVGYVAFVSNLISVGALIASFIFKNEALIIALVAVILFLLVVLVKFFSVINKIAALKAPEGSLRFATYIRYSTQDGRFIKYEVHKHMQCKTLILGSHIHKFHWTGSKPPLVKSDLQDVVNQRSIAGNYDEVELSFKKPLTYNDWCVVHIQMELDDTDNKSSKHCELSVKEPVQLVSFRIDLRHLNNNHDAKITEKRSSDLFSNERCIANVCFDRDSKSYEYIIHNPQMGYTYKIDWN